MTDGQINEYISKLLETSREDRISSSGRWADSFDSAMAMWEDIHPGTRPPAFEKADPSPPCFSGVVPPIFDGDLE